MTKAATSVVLAGALCLAGAPAVPAQAPVTKTASVSAQNTDEFAKQLFGAGPDLAHPVGGDWKLRFQANFLFPR
jgi:hypothetical protein